MKSPREVKEIEDNLEREQRQELRKRAEKIGQDLEKLVEEGISKGRIRSSQGGKILYRANSGLIGTHDENTIAKYCNSYGWGCKVVYEDNNVYLELRPINTPV